MSSSSRAIIVDARCLQDPDYAPRGVGRHSFELLAHFPRVRDFRLVGLIDPKLPDMDDAARRVFNSVRTNAYAAQVGTELSDHPIAYIALSPMTHNPLFGARLLADASILRVAIIYDFIPRREPQRYLPGHAQRLDYAIQLRWLAACDLFASISESSADDLKSILGVAPERVVVTGAPLSNVFDNGLVVQRPTPGRHILIVGGGDSRKNPDVVVRAHARSTMLQSARVPLVVAGNYGESQANSFRSLSEASGGDPSLVEIPGHVSDEELICFYNEARVVVCGSRDEGFSLPVIEGMAVGAAVLVSDIPAHAELVLDPQRRFPADDDEALVPLMDHAWLDADWRTSVIAEQNKVWPRFRAPEVAARLWRPLMAQLQRSSLPVCYVHRNARPRVAVLSPLPPDRSGVADYTAAMCRELGKLVELHAFTETVRPTPLPATVSVRPLSELPCVLPTFDRVIAVLGNSHFHLRIFELLQSFGGAAIAHDARMLGFYHGLLGQERTLAEASRELGRSVDPAELTTWLADESMLEALFLREIAEAASPMIVHSPITVDLVEQRHGVKPVYLPFSIYRPCDPEALTPANRSVCRRRLNIADDEVLIVTFGYVHPCKAPEECIWALESLRRWNIPAVLHFVGGIENLEDGGRSLLDLADRIGVGPYVKLVAEYVSERTYYDYLVAADAAIQLRTYRLGGLSGALLDCAAAGLPTVANNSLAMAVGVPDYFMRCIPDALSPVLLAEQIADLIESGITKQRPEEQRRAFSEKRSFSVYSRLLCDALHLEPADATHHR